MTEELSSRLDAATSEMVKFHSLAIECLTEKQLAEAIAQAILSGDFIRHVTVNSSSQCVVYIPYHGIDKLKAENAKLKEVLHNARLLALQILNEPNSTE